MADAHGAWCGRVTHIHIAPRAFLPMGSRDAVELVAGRGITGDRYAEETGFHSHKPEAGRQVTLFESETLEALERDHQVALLPGDHRRNITTRGVPLNHLVGQSFLVGEVLLQATRLSTPCRHLDEITGKEVLQMLVNRSGINCIIVRGGTICVGDTIRLA